MVKIGYTMMCEQAGPRELVRDAVAERVGFDFAVISDHYFPWLVEQGHSPYAWSVLGAAAQATERIPLMTYVTCPTFRCHPAVIAQKAATVALLSEGRFTLGVGAGENLNEHVVGGGWPGADVRHERLREAVEIIRALWGGEYVNYLPGQAFRRGVGQGVGPARGVSGHRYRCVGRPVLPVGRRTGGRHDRRRARRGARRVLRRRRGSGQAADRATAAVR